MGFSENLIKLRRSKGLSQEQLGDEVGVARQTVSKWELGETTPEMDKLIALSLLFEIGIDELVDNKDFISKSGDDTQTNQRHDWKKIREKIKTEYEYESEKTIGNLPLVSINIGKGKRTAKGIFALGNKAYGIFAIGGIAGGIFSIGLISFGLISIGIMAVSLLCALGIISISPVAVGALAIGIFAIGGISIGIFSLGGIAVAKNIALGGCAIADIAIGQFPIGDTEIPIETVTSETNNTIREMILQKFPNIWKPILYFYSNMY